jgi:Uncharacterized phage-associated protein
MAKPVTSAPHDPRSVANLLLDLAEEQHLPITNLALQKLLYFAHGHFLIRTGRPLLSGSFEAWQYGPVHPAVYREFKVSGARAITTRAIARDVMSGIERPLPPIDDIEIRNQLVSVLSSYGHLSPGRLVDISHAPKGPWATIVNKAKTSVSLGMRIPDNVTVECFKYQKVSVGVESRVGEPNEDSPFV